jgi:hypothetical protein
MLAELDSIRRLGDAQRAVAGELRSAAVVTIDTSDLGPVAAPFAAALTAAARRHVEAVHALSASVDAGATITSTTAQRYDDSERRAGAGISAAAGR